MAALTVDPFRSVKKGPFWKVGDFKEDGVVMNFPSPRDAASFNLGNGTEFPAHFQVWTVLAEQDPGAA